MAIAIVMGWERRQGIEGHGRSPMAAKAIAVAIFARTTVVSQVSQADGCSNRHCPKLTDYRYTPLQT